MDDTNSVYLNVRIDVQAGPNHYDTLYYFERFFSEGQYFSSAHYERKPTKKDFANLRYGTIGYYSFDDNEILVETFTRTDHGSYLLSKLRPNGDKFVIYKEKKRCRNCGWSRVNLVYEKMEVDSLIGIPDW